MAPHGLEELRGCELLVGLWREMNLQAGGRVGWGRAQDGAAAATLAGYEAARDVYARRERCAGEC